jgi:hypothetical protein
LRKTRAVPAARAETLSLPMSPSEAFALSPDDVVGFDRDCARVPARLATSRAWPTAGRGDIEKAPHRVAIRGRDWR